MAKFLLVIIFLGFIFISSSFAANWQAHDIEGEWISVNPRTRGISSIVVSQDGSGWSVEAWGKCHPRDCVWGSVALTPIGESVEDGSFNRGFAIWDAGFALKYVTFTVNRDRLTAETITVFKDRSRRASFRSVEVLRRADEGLSD